MAFGEMSRQAQDETVRCSFAGAKEYAQLYEGSTPLALFFNERLRHVLDILAPLRGGKLLELGCGPGILLDLLCGGQFQLFGLDCSPEMIAEARSRTAGHAVNLTIGQIEQLPFPAASFDVILALGVLEYVEGLGAGLQEIARVAKPNALIVVSMLNKRSFYQMWERTMYSSWRSIRRLLSGRSGLPSPILWLHSPKSLMKMMKACQFEHFNDVHYGLNVCVSPFDAKYPLRAIALNRWVEAHCGKWFPRALHTGFILSARKCERQAPENDES